LGILDSITRRVVGELWPEVREVVSPLEDLLAADEVMVVSTLREVTPVRRVGDTDFPVGPVTAELRYRLAALVGQS
jgi:branched-subunit amino acid aminotransferase/4-amino-4-deoxychorismate lyase